MWGPVAGPGSLKILIKISLNGNSLTSFPPQIANTFWIDSYKNKAEWWSHSQQSSIESK